MLPVILENKFVTIHFDAGLSMLRLEWLDYYTADEYKEVLKIMIDTSKERDVKYWLTDSRRLEFLLLSNVCSALEVMGAELRETNVRKIARIRSKDILNENQIAEKVKAEKLAGTLPFDVGFFDDETSAMNWLNETVSLSA